MNISDHSLSACSETDERGQLRHAVEHAAHLLPAQGPIEVFVHHNTLHAFEDLPFHQAVIQAAELYGCQPYLSEDCYLEQLSRGRIRIDDLSAVLLEDLGEHDDQLIGLLGTRFHLRLAILQHPLRIGSDSELQWMLAETDILRRFGPDIPMATRQRMIDETRHWIVRDFRKGERGNAGPVSSIIQKLFTYFEKRTIDRWNPATWEAFTLQLLWEVCQFGVGHACPGQPLPPKVREPSGPHPPLAGGPHGDRLVNEILIRFCAAFLDQGFSHWRLPQREAGFYQSFSKLYRDSRPADRWLKGLSAELRRLEAAGIGPLESLDESLHLLSVSGSNRSAFLREQLLALPGWAGMIWQMETNTEWAVYPAPAGSLIEYLAVRLILERLRRSTSGQSGSTSTPASAGIPPMTGSPLARAFQVFQLAQVRGWSPFDLQRLSKDEWLLLNREIQAFPESERRKIYHRGYERRYRTQVLDALRVHAARLREPTGTAPSALPTFQIICCIDDREESFRRHLEEVDSRCQTFAAAGFFAVAMYYRGIADAHFRPLCPNIIKPSHYVQEEVVYSLEKSHRRRSETRRAIATASHRWHIGTRTFVGGIVTGLLGSLASIPMVTRILLPRTTAQIRKYFGRMIHPLPLTELRMHRDAGPATADNPGYSLEEMTEIVERILRDIGLTVGFSRLVIFAGHGSSSLNNPHESAYNCGACSGGHGGANARVFCRMANDPRVRQRLAAHGLLIPDETVFLGCEHNTCDEGVEFFDLDRLPLSHVQDFEQTRQAIDEARRRNAHERCRRFESADLTLTPSEALLHVEARAEDLSQARPEYNHATNALCIVGRRELTRGLFLDRRAFLVSYDAFQDDVEHSILARILAAAVPVCAGISLEYYFSAVDVTGYGCGSKLPHNITSLLGVMEGAASDLRPGLSAQMVEIHEPLRILFVVESSPEALLSIMQRNETIDRLVRNEWVQLAVVESREFATASRTGTSMDPQGPTIHLFQNGQFQPYVSESGELPVVSRSLDWYRGWRDHLGAASINPASERMRQTSRGVEVNR